MVGDIRITDFDYDLPDSFIPRYPLAKRDDCRLLVADPQGRIFHRNFNELPSLIPPAALLICNETKVIRARLAFHKDTGAAIEIFLLEPLQPADYALNFQATGSCEWKCMVGNLKKWKEGKLSLILPEQEAKAPLTLLASKVALLKDGSVAVKFEWENPDISFSSIIERAGTIPIPPYLNRESEESDLSDYQTVYAREQGSVAAPTAGLHFTPEVFKELEAHAVTIAKLTVHVGAGTFRPVKSDTISGHDMHSERFSISLNTLQRLYHFKKEGRPVVAVGTTSVRTLESLPYIADAWRKGTANPLHLEQWRPYEEGKEEPDAIESLAFLIEKMKTEGMDELQASTAIIIAPGFKWKITDGMVTNFHQPKSTLLLLVSSFLGKGDDYNMWRKVYESAIAEKYRFLSYGDASLLIRPN